MGRRVGDFFLSFNSHSTNFDEVPVNQPLKKGPLCPESELKIQTGFSLLSYTAVCFGC